MIILDNDETFQSSERSPLKSPVSSIPAANTQYDTTSQPPPPPYITTPTGSSPLSPHSPHPHHHHQHNHHPELSSPFSPHHPHSPYPLPHPRRNSHHRHPDFIPGGGRGTAEYAVAVHSTTTNLPPHVVKMIEDREIRHKTLWRFFKSFVVAWLIILLCSTLIRGTANVIVHTNHVLDTPPNPLPRPPRYQFVSWPLVTPAMDGGTELKNLSVEVSIAIPRPSVSVTITPTPVAERLLSIAYPPPSSTSPIS